MNRVAAATLIFNRFRPEGLAVGKTEIYVDDFKVPIPIPLEARGAVREPFPANRTVTRLGVCVVGRLRGHRK